MTASLEAPERIARWRVIGNFILAIPHLILLYVLNIVGEVLAIAAWFSIVFTGKLPEGIGPFMAGIHRYQYRVTTYLFFVREQYPAFTVPSGYADPGGDPARLDIVPPTTYNRLAVLLRFIWIIPQAIFAIVVVIVMYVAWIVGFFAVLFTGKWPEGVRKMLMGCEFWAVRVNAWYFLLADPYPPFTISD
ncbi:MAG: DUF4389 domain-containing protein [Acidimicrobiales bacterium]